MVPTLVLVISFVALRTLGRLGVPRLESWIDCLRLSLALMFLVTASAHFGSLRQDLVNMVPPFVPRPELAVTVTGLLEIAGAFGLVVPATARLAASALALLLVLMFPANVYAVLAEIELGGRPATPLLLRAAMQVFFLVAVLAAGFGRDLSGPLASRSKRIPRSTRSRSRRPEAPRDAPLAAPESGHLTDQRASSRQSARQRST